MARVADSADTALPRIALLGRSPFTTMVSSAGGGFTRFGDIAINRWRNDGTSDDYGQWCYLKDVATGRVWSSAHQPVCARADAYSATLANDCVTISRRDGTLETVTMIAVDPEARTEARRIVVTNHSEQPATVEVTSYQEIVIAPHVSDRGHRAFSNLFVQTEWHPTQNSIIAMRRPRSAVDTPTWCGHTVSVRPGPAGNVSCETDRSVFIGRGRTARNPAAMESHGELAGTVGAVLDPVLALRVSLEIGAGQSAEAIFTTYLAEDRDDAERLAKSYSNPAEALGLFAKGHADSEAMLAEMELSERQTLEFQDLASTLLYGIRPAGKPPENPGAEPTRDDLLAAGVTGEWPVVMATLDSASGIARFEELLAMHSYWRMKGIACDLVVVCAEHGDGLVEQVKELVDDAEMERLNKPRGVWVFGRSSLTERQTTLFQSLARINVDCEKTSPGNSIDG